MTTPSPYKVSISLSGNGSVLAHASIEGKTMRIHGFKVFKKKDGSGLFVSEPSQKSGEKWYPIVEILSKEHRQAISNAILTAYDEAIKTTEGGRDDEDAVF